MGFCLIPDLAIIKSLVIYQIMYIIGILQQNEGKKGYYHCHLNKGHPRYVAVWKVTDYEIRLMEIRYVGSHENADYQRIN